MEVDRTRRAGFLPGAIAAALALAAPGVYVGLMIAQEDRDVVAATVITAFISGLGICALVGALRTRPDRVIALGAAAGGLIGAAVVSLLSIGLLLLVAGIFALVAWTRTGVDASPRQQLLAGLAGIGAALGFLLFVFFI